MDKIRLSDTCRLVKGGFGEDRVILEYACGDKTTRIEINLDDAEDIIDMIEQVYRL